MGYAKLDRAGTWTYYECKSCFRTAWYHESDPRVCKRCGSTQLIESPPSENEEERIKRDRELGLY